MVKLFVKRVNTFLVILFLLVEQGICMYTKQLGFIHLYSLNIFCCNFDWNSLFPASFLNDGKRQIFNWKYKR